MKGTSEEKLVSDFQAVVADVEDLLSETASQTGEKVAAVRAKLKDRLSAAKVKLGETQEVLADKTRQAAEVTDTYVKDNPWQSVIIAAGVGFIIGFLSRR